MITLIGVLGVPLIAAALLAVIPDYRLSARLNGVMSFIAFVAATLLFWRRPAIGDFILVDDLNVVFIVLSTFVGFTTSVFSASYIGHELETGRLTPAYLRFYHAMFQVMMFGMNLALVSNNIGLMWVAVELATLSTVMMVGIYRTHEALEAAWKYFILGSVGIALALFGTILVYLAALDGKKRIGMRRRAMIEPRATVGKAHGIEAIKIARAAFEADRLRKARAKRRIAMIGAISRQMPDRATIKQREMHPLRLAPEAEQGRAGGQARHEFVPRVHPSSAATCWNHATNGAGR